MGKNTCNYDGEIFVVQDAAKQLLALDLPPGRVVFFIDSQAAVSALSSNSPTDCPPPQSGPHKSGGTAPQQLGSTFAMDSLSCESLWYRQS
ncbi:hypothetical protein CDAR_17771 [Caerostris darwini]|uniref:Uncharacterized protein n=1 Tax=Caerostris darwini TaxID=1538125 RepID=A0AAV4MCT7_9ARAC|nr:hypothetical protein CDAR_17771 [Caerostris darwini]